MESDALICAPYQYQQLLCKAVERAAREQSVENERVFLSEEMFVLLSS